jgi:hypothetical protein
MQKEATIDEANAARLQSFALFVFTLVTLVFVGFKLSHVGLIVPTLSRVRHLYRSQWHSLTQT